MPLFDYIDMGPTNYNGMSLSTLRPEDDALGRGQNQPAQKGLLKVNPNKTIQSSTLSVGDVPGAAPRKFHQALARPKKNLEPGSAFDFPDDPRWHPAPMMRDRVRGPQLDSMSTKDIAGANHETARAERERMSAILKEGRAKETYVYFPSAPEVNPKFVKDSMDMSEIYGAQPGQKTGPGERAASELRSATGLVHDTLKKGDDKAQHGRVLEHLREGAVGKAPRPLLVTEDVAAKSFIEDFTKTHRHTSTLVPAYRIHGEWIDRDADSKIHPSALTRTRANESELDMSLNHHDIPGAVPRNIGTAFPHMKATMKATERPGGGNRGNLDIPGSTPGTGMRARNPTIFAQMEEARRRSKHYEEEQEQLRLMQTHMTHFADKALKSNMTPMEYEATVQARLGKTLANREFELPDEGSASFDPPQGTNRALRRNMGPGMRPLPSGSFEHVKAKEKYANPTGKVLAQQDGPDNISYTMKKYLPADHFHTSDTHTPQQASILAKKSNMGHGFLPHGGGSSFEEVKVKQRRNYKVDMRAAMMESMGHKMFSLNSTAPPATETGSLSSDPSRTEAPTAARVDAAASAESAAAENVSAATATDINSQDVREDVSAVRALGGDNSLDDTKPVDEAVFAGAESVVAERRAEARSGDADSTTVSRARPQSPDPSLFPKEAFQARKQLGRRKYMHEKKLGADLLPVTDSDDRPGKATMKGGHGGGIGPGMTLLNEQAIRGKAPFKIAPGAPQPGSSDPVPFVSHFVTSGHGATKSTLGDVLYAGKFGKTFDRPWDNVPKGMGKRSELTGVGEGNSSLTRIGAGVKPDGKPASVVLQKSEAPESDVGRLTVADSDRLRRIQAVPKGGSLTLTSFRDRSNAPKLAMARQKLLAEIDSVRCLP